MDDLELYALGRRAVDCDGWRWLPGMLPGELGSSGLIRRLRVLDGQEAWFTGEGAAHLVPILEDPATVGCLMALVREARGTDVLCPIDAVGLVEALEVSPPMEPEGRGVRWSAWT